MSDFSSDDGVDVDSGGQLGRREFLVRAGKVVGAASIAGSFLGASPVWARGSAVTLKVLYLSQSPSEIKLVENYSKQFAKQTGIGAQVTPIGYDAFNRSFPLTLRAHRAADVAYGNSGITSPTQFGDEGYLVDLTPHVIKRGWAKNFSMDIIKYPNLPGNTIWTIPYDMVTVGNYYNKAIFDRLHIKPPTTFAGYEAMLAKLKNAGVTPIAVGAKDYNFNWIFDQLTHTSVPFNTLWQLNRAYNPKARWPMTAFVKAATTIQNWSRKGYFQDLPLGMSTTDAENFFLNEDSAIVITGSWNNSRFIDTAKFPLRFFATPRYSTKVPYHMGGFTPNNDWMIVKANEHQTEALQYLDWVLSEKVARALWNSGDIVAYRFKSVPRAKHAVQTDVYRAMQRAKIGTYGIGPATMGADFTSIFQELISDSVTPREAMTNLRDAYVKATKKS